MAQEFVTETITKIHVIVPIDAHLRKIVSIGNDTSANSPLIEFEYLDDTDEYLSQHDILTDEEEFSEDDKSFLESTAQTIKRYSPGGEIIDIKFKLNGVTKIDSQIVKLWKQTVQETKRKQKFLSKNAKSEQERIESQDNLDLSILQTGLHKHKGKQFEGTLIEFFIKAPKVLTKGDKLSNRFGNKGVISQVLSEEDTPYTKRTGKIDTFISPLGILKRKNNAVVKELYIGKIFYLLPDIIAKLASDKTNKIEDIRSEILKIYDLLDPTEDKRQVKSIESTFQSIDGNKLRKLLIDKEFTFNYIVPPFNTPNSEDIKEAATLLKIPLDEYVYIPRLKMWTKKPVPVGVQYYSSMEQLSSDYESSRGTAGYVSSTGQPTKGKS